MITASYIVLLALAILDSANAASETRSVSGYTGVSAGGAFLVNIDISGREGCRVETKDPAIIPLVDTVVENQVLHIRFKPQTNLINIGLVTVFVDAVTVKLDYWTDWR